MLGAGERKARQYREVRRALSKHATPQIGRTVVLQNCWLACNFNLGRVVLVTEHVLKFIEEQFRCNRIYRQERKRHN